MEPNILKRVLDQVPMSDLLAVLHEDLDLGNSTQCVVGQLAANTGMHGSDTDRFAEYYGAKTEDVHHVYIAVCYEETAIPVIEDYLIERFDREFKDAIVH